MVYKKFLCFCFFLLILICCDFKSVFAETVRITGKDRFEVAVNVSKEGWSNGSETVFLSNYLAFADALSAAPLAYKFNSPILLTRPNELNELTKNEIKRLSPSKIYIIGGSGSINENVVNELKKIIPSIERIDGVDRFEVSYNISKHFTESSNAFVANGLKFPDALSIAPYAAQMMSPILLTKEKDIPQFTAKALIGKSKTTVIGGTGSVSDLVYRQLPSPKRIGGADRFEVARNIVREFELTSKSTFVATGFTFADALTGSVLAAKEKASLLLTRPDRLPLQLKQTVIEKEINSFTVLGGTGSIQEATARNLAPLNNTHQIEGYSSSKSYTPGQTIDLYIHSPASNYSIDFIRFGQQKNLMHTVRNLSGKSQKYYPQAYVEGALWQKSFSYQIPSNWSSGMYAARIFDDKNEFYVTFIVKDKSSKNITVLASTNTWEAYNSWGGKSLYSYERKNNKLYYNEIVSFERPNPGATPIGNEGHLANGERHILSWLEKNQYSYSMLTDMDVHQQPNRLKDFDAVIVSTHSEYWTTSMYNALKAYLNNGGSVLYLSGNGIYWRSAINGQQIEVKKDGGYHSFTKEKGGLFYQTGTPETALVGVGYRSTGFSVPAPYQVVNSSHWIFKGTGVKNGSRIGARGLNTVKGSSGGASGWETDQVDRDTPNNYVMLAKGTNTTGAGAHMIYYDHKGGGGVFSTGSITFGGSLAVDDQLTQMVKNVLNHFLK
jgi:putative cell wall-binding protein